MQAIVTAPGASLQASVPGPRSLRPNTQFTTQQPAYEPPVGAALLLALYLVVRLGMVHEYFAFQFGVNSHYSYILIPLLLVAAAFSGDMPRALGSRIGLWMCGFVVWIAACIPTSAWPGGSFELFTEYVENNLTIFVAAACLTSTLKRQTRVMTGAALSIPIFTAIVLIIGTYVEGRYTIPFGTYSNPNDLAHHVLFLAPFALCGTSAARWIAVPALLGSVLIVFRTGSRGGFIILCVLVLTVFLRLSIGKKMAAIAVLLLAVPIVVALLPRTTLLRYQTIFQETPVESDESAEADNPSNEERLLTSAVGSWEQRRLTLTRSLQTSFRNPIFGVGPGQYAVYDAARSKSAGARAQWVGTHNSYTQAASEMGLVGCVFFTGLFLSTGAALRRLRKTAREAPHLQTIARTAGCLLLCWTVYGIACLFAQLAFKQYLPLLAGLTVGLQLAAERLPQASPAVNTP
jgi:O-antigen ligase